MGKNRIFVSTELGEFFRSARKERGLSQLELSAEIGVHQGIISNIERGAYQAEPSRLEKLCRFYGLQVSDLENYRVRKYRDQLDSGLRLIAIEHVLLVDRESGYTQLREFEEEKKIENGSKDTTFDPTRAVTYHLKGKYYERKKEWNDALEHYELAVKYVDLHPELLPTNIKAASYNALGRVCNRMNHLDRALYYIQKGLDSFVEGGARSHIRAHLQITKASVLEKQDRDGEALKIIEEIWNEKDQLKSGSARLNITQIRIELLNKLKRYDEAIEYALADLHDARLNRLYDRCFELWTSLGESYASIGQLANAELCYQTALKLEPKIKDKQIAITTYTQLGLLYLDQGQMELAHTALEEAVRQGKKHKDSYRLVKALIALADCLLMQRYDMKALEHYQEALKLTEKHSFDTLRFDVLLEMTEIAEKNNLPTYQKYIDEFRQSALSLRDRRGGRKRMKQIKTQSFINEPPDED